MFGADLGRPPDGRAKRDFFEEPGERERDDRDRHAPEEDTVQRTGERMEEVVVHGRREAAGCGGAQVDAAAETRENLARELESAGVAYEARTFRDLPADK